ncbi:MAG: ABC transporter ATP-binding protein [Pseudomonadota bacterium]
MIANIELKHYLRTFLRFDLTAIRRTALLNFATALTEGAGFMLLVPMLSIIGILGDTPTTKGIGSEIADLLLGGFTQSNKLLAVLALYVILIAMQSVLTLLRDRQIHSLQHRFVDHLREMLYAAIARARWNFLSQRHSSELLSVLTMDIQRVGLGTHFLLQLATVSILSFAYLVVAVQLSLPVTVLALAIGVLLWWMLRRTQDVAKQNGVMLTQANHGLFAQAQEFMAAIKLVKIHGEEAGNVRQFTRAVEDLRERMAAFHEVRSKAQTLYRIGGALALAALTYLSLMVIKTPTVHLLVMVAIFSRLLPSLSQVHGGIQQLWHMLPAYANWCQLMDECQAHSDIVNAPNLAPVNLEQSIVLQQVVYRHTRSNFMLRSGEVVIPAYRTTAIVGPSGSGKSTLLDILSGLTPPDEGRMLVDGAPLTAHAGWRQRIAYIPQETTILDGTVRDNLTWGNGNVAEDDLWSALEQAAAADFVRRLPQMLETRVGERGVRLSGGERQRLALARALLRQPQLLILDEATSALDHDNQRVVLEAIRALHGQMTVLIVTHRHEELTGLIDGHIYIQNGVVSAWQPEQKAVAFRV